MAKGMKIPVGIDIFGGAAMVDGEDNDYKTISTSLSNCDSDHAFQQDLGIDIGVVFQPVDNAVKAKVLRRVRDIFKRFEDEDRYRLLGETIRWSTPNDGELVLEFKYLNIETDQVRSFAKNLSTRASVKA